MSSLENGPADARGRKRGCSYKARIKPRQACNCHAEHKDHRKSAGGIYGATSESAT